MSRSTAAKKAWDTRRKNAAKRSNAAHKAWATRRANAKANAATPTAPTVDASTVASNRSYAVTAGTLKSIDSCPGNESEQYQHGAHYLLTHAQACLHLRTILNWFIVPPQSEVRTTTPAAQQESSVH